ncbi:hypothetical protein, partial [Pseudomonas syringae]|uniref:hypothetical protein n=1 Tax=Pseudomonas syringae TaxID=317 RepID=UPI001E5DDD23
MGLTIQAVKALLPEQGRNGRTGGLDPDADRQGIAAVPGVIFLDHGKVWQFSLHDPRPRVVAEQRAAPHPVDFLYAAPQAVVGVILLAEGITRCIQRFAPFRLAKVIGLDFAHADDERRCIATLSPVAHGFAHGIVFADLRHPIRPGHTALFPPVVVLIGA